jgi:hypothetical protein
MKRFIRTVSQKSAEGKVGHAVGKAMEALGAADKARSSKLGGLNIKKCLQPREIARGKIAFADTNGKPT